MALLRALALALPLILAAADARAAACTKGTDCYCDCIAQNPPSGTCAAKYPGIVYDTALALCEDWEQPGLYLNTGFGAGAPNYGPWYDETGTPAPTRRGYNSYWTHRYQQGTGNSTWTAGNPASPKLGVTCLNSVCREAEYCGTGQAAVVGVGADCWDGNSVASIDIQRAGDYDDEVGSFTGPDPFDGLQHMARRIRTGVGSQAELNGRFNFTSTTTLGWTSAIALSNNWISSGLTGAQWKWDEWSSNDGVMFPFGATSEYGTSENMPFMPFMDVNDAYQWTFDGGDNSCVTAAAAATKTHGNVTCDTRYRFFPDPARYQRSTDWTNDAWHCVKGEIAGIGTSAMRLRVWYDGDDEADVIIDVTVDGTKVHAASGIGSFAWNAYSNWKEANTISSPVYRHYDNVHVRRGSPVSCASIGFSGGSPPVTPPLAPAAPTLAPGVNPPASGRSEGAPGSF